MTLFKDEQAKKLATWVGLAAAGLALFLLGIWVAPDGEAHSKSEPTSEQSAEVWTCSMHPQVRKPEAGECPICGMDLIPVGGGDEQGEHAHHRVVLSERAQALAKLRTTKVQRQGSSGASLRLLGRIEPNEATLKTVTAWTGGRIDRLHVNVTGQRVRAGQVIASLYSPEIFAAHQDLLVAKQQAARMGASPAVSRQGAEAALRAARERLSLLGVSDGDLTRMEKQDGPSRSVPIRSPFAGTVIERMATEGAYVSTGTPLYRIANLGTLWVQLDAYESDLSRIQVGQKVRVSVEALPGELFEGEVRFIDPTLDPQRRTAQVRVQVENKDGRLRPGTFAEATVVTDSHQDSPGRSPLVVPETAPLFTGRRSIVYVEIKDGERTAYAARTVRLGPRMGDVYPVVAGLKEGERVVSRGAFAVDADLQIRGGASMMAGDDDRQTGAWDTVVELSGVEKQKLKPLVSAYLLIQVALADDDVGAAKKAAQTLADAAKEVEIERPQKAKEVWAALRMDIRNHAEHVAMAQGLEGAREGFERLSNAIIGLLSAFGNPEGVPLRVAHCPMASGSDGARWVQLGDKVDNPYFGASMLDCGEVREEVASGAFLQISDSP